MRTRLSLAVVMISVIAAPIPIARIWISRQAARLQGASGVRAAYVITDGADADGIYLWAGGRHVLLFRAPCAVRDLVWAPDGSRFACTLWADLGRRSIAIVPAEGGKPLGCTDPQGADGSPCWSPDSSRLAFTSERDGAACLYAVGADCTGQRRLSPPGRRVQYPAWSPDGLRLAYQGTRGDSDEVCVIDADGSGDRQLTDNPGFDGHPAWRPDGSRLVFVRRRRSSGGLYLMRPDGGGQRPLVRMRGSYWPAWSPDGSRIAFSGGIGAERGLWMVCPGGGPPKRLTPPAVWTVTARPPTWLPDSRRLLFAGNSGDGVSVYCLDTDTLALHPLAHPSGLVPAICAVPGLQLPAR